MAAPAASKPATFRPQVALPSRLIPGLPVPSRLPPRKKAVSVSQDGAPWAWQDALPVPAPAKPGLWLRLAETVLPRPATRSQRLGLTIQVLTDFVFIFVGFAAVGARLHLGVGTGFADLLNPQLFPSSALGLLPLFGVVFTLLGYSERLYHPDIVRVPWEERLVLAKVVVLSTVLMGTTLAWSGVETITLPMLAVSAPVNFVALLSWREWRRRRAARALRDQGGMRNVLIVGAGTLGQKLAHLLEHDLVRVCMVRGFIDETAPLDAKVRGRLEDLARVARSEFVDEIILTIPLQSEAARRVIREARRNRIDVKVVPDLLGFDPAGVMLEKLGDVPVLTLCEERIPAFGLLLKRAIDLVFSAIGLFAGSPIFAAVAVAIKLDSSGPVLYRAPRLGLKGRRFLCCKFRTMATNADSLKEKLRELNEREGPFFKLANDPRVTRVGRFLRRYSLDELPQLWNVLRGEMSLVGPRPHPVDDFERYDLEDWQRLEVLPGLTGLWQVTARSDPSFERGMTLDREYIASWSLWVDFCILSKTAAIVLRGEGV